MKKKLSVCCKAEMFDTGQCTVCGADGTHFEATDEEKQELIDEKIRFEYSQPENN